MSLWEYFQKRSVEVGVGYVLNLDGNFSWPKSLDGVKGESQQTFPSSALWPPMMWTFPPCAVKDSLWNHVLLHQCKKSQGIPITMSTPCTSWSLPSPNKRSQGFLGGGNAWLPKEGGERQFEPEVPCPWKKGKFSSDGAISKTIQKSF